MLDFVERVKACDEKLQREQLRLSNNSRFVETEHSGHNVHVTEPGVVVDEVLRMLEVVHPFWKGGRIDSQLCYGC